MNLLYRKEGIEMEYCVAITILNSTPKMEKSLKAILKPKKMYYFRNSENFLTFSETESMIDDVLSELTRCYKGAGILYVRQKIYIEWDSNGKFSVRENVGFENMCLMQL